ncbi:MAG: hypothetical protein WAV38_35810 [Xanthobacteraceae bacterium]
MDYNVRKLTNWRGVVWMLQLAVALSALTAMPTVASAQTDTETGRVQISFLKADRGSGSGYLFYQDQKYRLAIVGPEIRRIWATSIDLIGTASNLHSASDIIGTYAASDAGAPTIRRAKTLRLENKKGAVLEIRAVNLNRWSTLNLSGMTIKNVGWQPSPE